MADDLYPIAVLSEELKNDDVQVGVVCRWRFNVCTCLPQASARGACCRLLAATNPAYADTDSLTSRVFPHKQPNNQTNNADALELDQASLNHRLGSG